MSFNFMAAITICSDFGAPKIKSDTVYIVTYKPHGSHRPKIYNRYIRTKRKQKEIKETIPFAIATKRIKCQTLSFWGSKITAVGDCSHEIMMLTPWKKSYDQPR